MYVCPFLWFTFNQVICTNECNRKWQNSTNTIRWRIEDLHTLPKYIVSVSSSTVATTSFDHLMQNKTETKKTSAEYTNKYTLVLITNIQNYLCYLCWLAYWISMTQLGLVECVCACVFCAWRSSNFASFILERVGLYLSAKQ